MPQSLYDICLTKVSHLLKEEFWNTYPENPFSFFSRAIINDIISSTINFQSSSTFRSADLHLLLATGRVQHFELNNFEINDELIPVLESLSNCKNLQTLRLTDIGEFSTRATKQLNKLLCACTELEDLHSSVVFDLKALRNCSKLRRVRLHFIPDQPLHDILQTTGTYTERTSLREFRMCKDHTYKERPDFVPKLLVHCPNLHSLGYIDVYVALVVMHGPARVLGNHPPPYQLRSCFMASTYFPFGLTVAALALPHLEELTMVVNQLHHEFNIMDLNVLTNLTYLEIQLPDFCPELYYLLDEIGPKLKHLSIIKFHKVLIDLIFSSCPNLESLKVDCDSVVSDSVKAIGDLPNLQRLAFFCKDANDKESLQVILSKCFNLKELFLKNVPFINDNSIFKVLKKNPLDKLELACISETGMTQSGLKMFLDSAIGLKKIAFDSFEISKKDIAEVLCPKLVNPKLVIYSDYDILWTEEFFFRKRFSCQ